MVSAWKLLGVPSEAHAFHPILFLQQDDRDLIYLAHHCIPDKRLPGRQVSISQCRRDNGLGIGDSLTFFEKQFWWKLKPSPACKGMSCDWLVKK